MILRILIALLLAVQAYGAAVTEIGTNGSFSIGTRSNLISGLVGWWTFDGHESIWSSATAGTNTDRSGNGNGGIFTSMNLYTNPVSGTLGQAFHFLSASDLVSCGSGTSLDDIQNQGGGGMTVSFWIMGGNNSGAIFMSKGGAGYWRLTRANETTPQHRLTFSKDGTTDLSTQFATVIETNEWQYMALTWDGSSNSTTGVKLYRNTIPMTRTGGADGVAFASDAAASLTLGGVGGDTAFNGRLDDVRLYNRIITEAEIASLYKASRTEVKSNTGFPASTNTLHANYVMDTDHSSWTPGTALTSNLLNSAGHGQLGFWTATLGTAGGTNAAYVTNNGRALYSPVTVTNVTFPGGTNMFVFGITTNASTTILNFTNAQSNIVVGFFIRIGANGASLGGNYDYVQIRNNTNNGFCNCNVEDGASFLSRGVLAHGSTNGSSSSGSIVNYETVGLYYGMLWKSFTNCTLRLYDPRTFHAASGTMLLVGESTAPTSQDSTLAVDFGHIDVAHASHLPLYIGNVVVGINTNVVWPFGP